MKERDSSISLLKFIAALLILNSHMNWAYGEYEILATGGAIGDVLFFFCSGYTLFLGRGGSFGIWYKRRIKRIYPSVFAFGLISFLFFSWSVSVDEVVLNGGNNWFICCIMIYYAILYYVRKYFFCHLDKVFLFFCLIVIIWYIFFFDGKETVYMYKSTYFKWCHYFLFMLQGAIMGKVISSEGRHDRICFNMFVSIGGLLLCLFSFYGLQILGGKMVIVSYLQILTLLPLYGIVFFIFHLARGQWLSALYNKKYLNMIVNFIGGLCLELYIVQMPILTGEKGLLPFGYHRDDIQCLFPLNIPILVVVVFITAYITRSTGRIFSQTFDGNDDYNWKKVFSLY